MHLLLVLVNCLGGLSLARNSVSRLTDCPGHYLNSVDWAIKPQIKHTKTDLTKNIGKSSQVKNLTLTNCFFLAYQGNLRFSHGIEILILIPTLSYSWVG